MSCVLLTRVLLHDLTVTLVDELQQLVEAARNVRRVAIEHRRVAGHDAVRVIEHDDLRLSQLRNRKK